MDLEVAAQIVEVEVDQSDEEPTITITAEALARLLKSAGEASSSSGLKQIGAGSFLFGDLFNRYVDFKSRAWAETTLAGVLYVYNNHLSIHFAHRDIRTIQATELQTLINNRLDVLRPGTVDKIRGALSGFYTWLSRLGTIQTNPMLLVNMPPYDNVVDFTLPKGKTEQLIGYIFSIDEAKWRALFFFLLHGRRRSEVLTMKSRNVHIENGIYRIDYVDHKSRKSKTFALEPHMVEALQAFRWGDTYVFEGRGGKSHISESAVFKRMEHLRQTIGVNMRLHDFRHLIGYIAINQGKTLTDIAHILGQESEYSARRYTRVEVARVQTVYREIFGGLMPC